MSKIPDVSIVENSAELLYGLVHQRFILTKAGLAAMVRWGTLTSLAYPAFLIVSLVEGRDQKSAHVRSTSTKRATLAGVLGSSAMRRMSFPAGEPICPASIR